MTPETIAKLEQAFLFGASDREASLFAGIAPSTLYRYCEEYPEFSERKELLKEQTKIKAKMNIARHLDEGDKALSQWLLERRDPTYKTRMDVTTDDKPVQPITGMIIKHDGDRVQDA